MILSLDKFKNRNMLILRKGATVEEMEELSKKIGLKTSKKGLDTSKYIGTVKFNGEDG